MSDVKRQSEPYNFDRKKSGMEEIAGIGSGSLATVRVSCQGLDAHAFTSGGCRPCQMNSIGAHQCFLFWRSSANFRS
jgi:hypothetical protein